MNTFEYNKDDLDILATALKEAFESVGCDLRCFDWLSYNPDRYIQKDKK